MSKEFIELGNGKNVISFAPPAMGKLCRNIFTGEYIIAEHNRAVPVTFEQGEKLIKTYFFTLKASMFCHNYSKYDIWRVLAEQNK